MMDIIKRREEFLNSNEPYFKMEPVKCNINNRNHLINNDDSKNELDSVKASIDQVDM